MQKLFIFLILCLPFSLAAQDNWNQQGDLEDSQIIIEKDRKIDLPKANRDFKKVPAIDRQQTSIPVDFRNKDFVPRLSSIQPRLRVLTIKDEKLEKLYANQVKVGVGNYTATYLEGAFANKRSRNKSYGLNVLHQSFANGPVDQRNSGSGYQHLSPYLKLMSEKVQFEVELYYERMNNHLYGYDTAVVAEVDRDSIQRTFHTIGARLGLTDKKDSDKYGYEINAEAYQLFTNFNSTEFSVEYDLNNTFAVNEEWDVTLRSNGFFTQLTFLDGQISSNRNLFRIQPGIVYSRDKFELEGGLNLVNENDTLENMNKLHVFPQLQLSYLLLPGMKAYTGITGDVRGVRYKDLLHENPFLDDSIGVYHTLMPFKFFGGIKGGLSNWMAYELGFSVASVQHNFSYQATYSSEEGETRYNTIYFDGNNTEANVFTTLSANFGNLKIDVRGDYFYYSLDTLLDMPFRPNFQLRARGSYLIANKIKVGVNAHLQGKMNSISSGSFPETAFLVGKQEIPAIYDLGLNLGYKLSERSEIFVQANNLIANKYEYYLAYPNRGFQILGGFTYSF